ncbi:MULTISPECIES: hypothetical protein [unclassified Thiomonas]|uniref:hypothetical protein n=1 Tax=unclassified Thiomonas TaxID=2625466 RepID=UPI00257DAE62|nr:MULTISPECIES: hypothetical protein [unclassified Thiomonas]
MKPIPWMAVAWFVISIIALGMSIKTFQTTTGPLHGHAPQSGPIPSPATAVAPAPVNPSAHTAATPQTPPVQNRPFIAAGDKLLKCVVNGQVTYTNNPQECPSGTASIVTVFPAKGYLATKP